MDTKIGLLDLLFLLTCNMAGIGVFSISHHVLSHAGSCIASLLLVVVSGVVATTFGMCYAELGSTYPQAGGDLNYLGRAYSKHLGTVYSLTSVAFILPLSCAVMSSKVSACFSEDIGKDPCILLLLALCCVLLVLGGRLLTWTVRLLFVSKVATVVFLLATSIMSFVVTRKVPDSAMADVWSDMDRTRGMSSMISGLCFTQFSFDGWNCGNYIANRVRSPGRTFPRAIFGSIWCVVLIYTLVNLSFMWVVPYSVIVENEFFMDEYFQRIGIPVTPRMVSVAVTLIPTVGSLVCSFVVCSGIAESLVPVKFSKKIESLSLAALSLVVFLFTKIMDVERMINRIAFGTSLFYSLSCLGLFLLKRRHPAADRPFSLPVFIPLLASILGASICGYIAGVDQIVVRLWGKPSHDT